MGAVAWAPMGVASAAPAPAKGATVTLTVTRPAPNQVGNPVTLTAQTKGPAGNPLVAGSVSFYRAASQSPICNDVTIDPSNGRATCTTSALPAGTDKVHAVFNGNGRFAPATSSVVTVVVNGLQYGSDLSVSPPATTVSGDPVTLTDTFSPASGQPPVTGFVRFTVNGAPIAGCTRVAVEDSVSNMAQCTTTALPVGNLHLGSAYLGSYLYEPSTTTPQAYTITKGASITITARDSANNPVGDPVTMTATATGPLGNPLMMGTVTFNFDGGPISGCSDIGIDRATGKATCTTTDLPVGSDPLTATFNGNSRFPAVTSAPLDFTINQRTAYSALTASPSGSAYQGDPVVLTDTFTVARYAPDPTGTVSFTANGTAISGCQNVQLDTTTETATCDTSSLPSGQVSLNTTYSGDTNYLPGGTTSLAYTVYPVISISSAP